MSLSKPLSIARLNDLILGSFSSVPPSETLDHLIRYLGTWSGTDKFFAIILYTIKLLIPLLRLRARLQYRAGLRKTPESGAADGYAKLVGNISGSRTLWRFWGILPIFQWLISLERKPHATRSLLTIERLQGFSMLAYYPLEHLSYLCSQGVLSSVITLPPLLFSRFQKTITLKPNVLGMWSCRCWALYVLLQFAHLREDRKLLQLRERSLRKAKGTGLTSSEQEEFRRRRNAFWNEIVVNSANLQMALHWSLEKGLFKNEIWVSVLGLVAAVASFRSGWKATALPTSPPSPTTQPPALDDSIEANGHDVSE